MGIKSGLHSAAWAARLEIARGLRRLADWVHEDDEYRLPGLHMVMVKGKGAQVIWGRGNSIGCPLFYRSDEYDKAFTPEGHYYEFDR